MTRKANAAIAAFVASTSTSLPVLAQDALDGRSVAVAAGAAIGITATDNQGLSTTGPRAEVIVEPSVNLALTARGARLQGFANYGLTGAIYSRSTSPNEVRNSLNAFGTAEVIDNRGFLEVGASISRQRRSAFGVLSPDPALGTSNQSDVATLRVAPALRGSLGSGIDYEARLTQSFTRSDPAPTSDLRTTNGQLAVRSAKGGKLGLAGELTGNIYDFVDARRTTEATLRAIATWSVDQDLAVSLVGGRETNNFRTPRRVASSLWGARAQWNPGPRTSLAIDAEHHKNWNTHSISFSHRLSRSAIVFSDSRSVTPPDARSARGSIGSAFDLLFLQLASIEPDPDKRRALVNSTLTANGIDPSQPVLADFLTSTLALERRQLLSLSWLGLRDTVTLGISRSRAERADTVAIPATGDDFANSSVVDRRGLLANLGHRLNRTDTLTLEASVQRTAGVLESQRSTLRSVALGWNGRLGRRSDLAVGAKHVSVTGGAQPYAASVLNGLLRIQF